MSVESALARLEKKAAQRVAALALEYHADLRETLSQPGAGRQYGSHTASAPGDPPAVQTGTLRNSVQAVQVDPLTWVVGFASVPYPDGSATTGEVAVWMEYGTRNVAPRAHTRPTLDAFRARKKVR